MRLAHPEYLLCLLLIVPLLVFGDRRATLPFSNIENLTFLGTRKRIDPRILLKLLRVATIVLFVVALTRPQTGKRFTDIPSAGIDLILALDTSESMMGLDFKVGGKRVPRLEVVKNVATEFVKQRNGDRMGVVVFGGEAFTLAPLTLDHAMVLDFISQIKSGMAGNATAIGSGLGVAVNRMKGLPGKSKVVILLTDGVNNSGRVPPLVAAQIASEFGIKVYTIGAGSKGQVPYRVDTPLGMQQIYRESDLDEETLKQIAEKTGGKYFRTTDTESLSRIYQEIDLLEKTNVKVTEYTEYTDLFHLFLLCGIAALLLEIILGNTLLRTLP
jgi:Ca-activated chloride channel family protein